MVQHKPQNPRWGRLRRINVNISVILNIKGKLLLRFLCLVDFVAGSLVETVFFYVVTP
jgi:hypothetical protein